MYLSKEDLHYLVLALESLTQARVLAEDAAAVGTSGPSGDDPFFWKDKLITVSDKTMVAFVSLIRMMSNGDADLASELRELHFSAVVVAPSSVNQHIKRMVDIAQSRRSTLDDINKAINEGLDPQ